MSYYRRPTSLPPMPFTGMLSVVDAEARRNEVSCEIARKDGREEPEYAKRAARALRAVERILVGTERFWDAEPPGALTIKEMIARHEATLSRPPVYVDPREEQRKAEVAELRAASTLEGGDE